MQAHELKQGRTFGVAFEHGDDFFESLERFCRAHDVRQGFIPMFIAGYKNVDIVGTCDRLEDPGAPVWDKVFLRNVEAVGGGTMTYDEEEDRYLPHIHVSVGLKEQSAVGHTSHLLRAEVQFLTEMMFVEIASPTMSRVRDPNLYDVPLLRYGS